MQLTAEQSTQLEAILRGISNNESRNLLRHNYYEGEQRYINLGVTVPATMTSLATVIGWPKKACTVRASRLHPRGFRTKEATPLVDATLDALKVSDFDRADEAAKQLALQYGCAFVFTSRVDANRVTHTVRSPRQATAALDPRTGEVTIAVERLGFNDYLVYTPAGVANATRGSLNQWRLDDFAPGVGRTTCTVYTHESTVEKPFGQSAITRPVMGLTDSAVRTLLRQEVSAEFFSSPQRYMLGADDTMFRDENGQPRPGWEIILGSLLVAPTTEDEETGERIMPQVGQFPASSMQPHSDQLRTIAMMFSGETSIPPSYLGVLHDNPTSASAILANEADLVTSTEDRQPEFAAARKSVMMDAAAILAGEWTPALEASFASVQTLWRDAGTANQQAVSQAVTTLVGAGILPAQSRVTWEMLGLDDATIERLEDDIRQDGTNQLLRRLAEQTQAPAADAAAQPPALAQLEAPTPAEEDTPDA